MREFDKTIELGMKWNYNNREIKGTVERQGSARFDGYIIRNNLRTASLFL